MSEQSGSATVELLAPRHQAEVMKMVAPAAGRDSPDLTAFSGVWLSRVCSGNERRFLSAIARCNRAD